MTTGDFTFYLDPGDWFILAGIVVIAICLGIAWWKFYAKPKRDSLAEIARCLNAAPWMRSNEARRRFGKAA